MGYGNEKIVTLMCSLWKTNIIKIKGPFFFCWISSRFGNIRTHALNGFRCVMDSPVLQNKLWIFTEFPQTQTKCRKWDVTHMVEKHTNTAGHFCLFWHKATHLCFAIFSSLLICQIKVNIFHFFQFFFLIFSVFGPLQTTTFSWDKK